MKSARLYVTLPIAITAVAFGCGKKSSSSTSTSPSPAPSVTPASPGSPTKTITTTDANEIFSNVSATAASTGSASGFNKSLGLDDSGPVSGDGDTTYCTAHGEPISPDSTKNTSGPDSGSTVKYMSDGDPSYVAAKTYCVITHDTGDEESLRGALSQMQLFACMIGKNANFDGQPHDLNLSDPTLLACFTNQGGTPSDLGLTKATLTAANPPAYGDSSWDFSTEFAVTIQGTVFDMKLLWKSSENKFGFASLMPPVGHTDTTGKSHDAFVVLVDTGAQRLILDSASQRLYSQGYARRFRVSADGTLDATNKFTKVDHVSFIESQVYAANSDGNSAPANPTSIGQGTVITASGDTTHGFLTEFYSCGSFSSSVDCTPEDPTLWTPMAGIDGKVFDGDGSGTGVTAIKLSSKADLAILLNPTYSTYVDPVDWYAKAPVPTWTDATMTAVQAN